MTFIIDRLIEYLETIEYPCPLSIRDFYKVQKLTTPLITIQEQASNNGVYLDNQPSIVQNSYQVEVYTKSKMIKGKAISSIDLAKEIATLVDKNLNERFGLTMTGDITVRPYSDTSVTRLVLRYIAYIDTRTNSIYRRV